MASFCVPTSRCPLFNQVRALHSCALCIAHVSECLTSVYKRLSATHNAALQSALQKRGKHLHSRYRCAIVPRTWLRCLVLQMSARQVKPRPIVHLRTLTAFMSRTCAYAEQK